MKEVRRTIEYDLEENELEDRLFGFMERAGVGALDEPDFGPGDTIHFVDTETNAPVGWCKYRQLTVYQGTKLERCVNEYISSRATEGSTR